MTKVVISGTGVFTPSEAITNEELVEAFNTYVKNFNAANKDAIERGEVEALSESSVPFIEKASGIQQRFVMNKDGILDPEIMAPRLPERPNEEPSILAEMAVTAARDALKQAGKSAKDVDAVLVAAGQDWRAVEAGCHAYAARDGRYRSLSRWAIEVDHLVGTIELPMQVRYQCLLSSENTISSPAWHSGTEITLTR